MTRAEFNKMLSHQQKRFADANGRIVENQPTTTANKRSYTAESNLTGMARIEAGLKQRKSQ